MNLLGMYIIENIKININLSVRSNDLILIC